MQVHGSAVQLAFRCQALHLQAHTEASHQFPLLRHLTLCRKLAQQSLQIGRTLPAVELHGHTQKFAKAAARLLQAPDLLHHKTRSKAVAPGLQTATHNHQGVILQEAAVGSQQGLISGGFNCRRLVIQRENAHLAAIAIDDLEAADDAGQHLGLAGFQHLLDRPFGKAAHFQRHFIKQVA